MTENKELIDDINFVINDSVNITNALEGMIQVLARAQDKIYYLETKCKRLEDRLLTQEGNLGVYKYMLEKGANS